MMQLFKLRIAFSDSGDLCLLLAQDKLIEGHILVFNEHFFHLSHLDLQPIVEILFEPRLQLELGSNTQEN